MNLIQLTETSDFQFSLRTPTSPYSRNPQPQKAHTLTLEVPTYFIHGHASTCQGLSEFQPPLLLFFPSHLPGSWPIPKPTWVMFISIFTSNSSRQICTNKTWSWCSGLDLLGPILYFRVTAQATSFLWKINMLKHAYSKAFQCVFHVARQEFCPSKNQKSPIGVGKVGNFQNSSLRNSPGNLSEIVLQNVNLHSRRLS